jgi:hypothetical protein
MKLIDMASLPYVKIQAMKCPALLGELLHGNIITTSGYTTFGWQTRFRTEAVFLAANDGHQTQSRLPLTLALHVPIPTNVSRLDGRSGKDRKVAGEESPGSMDVRCRITSGGADPLTG